MRYLWHMDNRQVSLVAKRRPPAAGMGRVKGSQNKITKALKDMILGALDDQDGGGQAYLTEQAKANPVAFMALLGKVLPITVAGDKENPLATISEVRVTYVDPRG